MNHSPQLQVGDNVTITEEGEFQNFAGIITDFEFTPKGLMVSVDLYYYCEVLSFPYESLEPL